MTIADEPTLPSFHDGGGPVPQTFSGYEIQSELGRGGMGVVYRALQASLKRTVALKMLTGVCGSDDVARFVAEAETAAALHHTNIVHIYEVGEKDRVPFFAMEFVEGGSLADRLKQGVFAPRDAAEMLMTLARAVHYAHVHGVVHRDLKPQNVLLDQAGVPKIADFGIAKRLDDDSQRTTTGSIMGTPGYMAPEQAGGKSRSVGPAADVYSLGAMLYELLAGRPPFLPHESDTPIYIRVISEPPVSPAFHRPDIPRDLEAICMMCLQKDPRDRFASAAALAEDLQRFLNDEPILAKPPPLLRLAIKWVRRHPARVVLCVVALGIAAWGSLAWWRFEMYERPRIEYASAVQIRHGGIEGLGPIDDSLVQHRGVCVRMTRQGRRGRIVKAEVVNPRGRPASVRDILEFDLITTWLEGVTGFAREAARGRETVSLDASYKDGEAVELIGRDRNRRVTVAIQYHATEGAPDGGTTGLASFRNARNFDYAMPSGASRVAFERSATGLDVKIRFFNSAGTPARNGEGVYGYSLDYTPRGYTELLRNLDASGAPMANLSGVTQVRYAWSTAGQLKKSQFEDRDGRLIEVGGVASIEIEYDTAGNAVRVRGLDSAGRLANSNAAEPTLAMSWAVKEFTHNDSGEVTAIEYRAAGPGGVEMVVSRLAIVYDALGFPHDCQAYGPDGRPTARLVFRCDERGNALERKSFDRDGEFTGWKRDQLDNLGNVVVSEELDLDGSVKERTTSVYEGDRLMSQAYTDEKGDPREVDAGYTRLDCRYHDLGHRVEERYSGFKSGPYLLKALLDERGRRTSEVWVDAEDRMLSGPNGWAKHTLAYDGSTARLLTERFEDAEGKPARHAGGYTTARYAYSERGVLVERIYEGYPASSGFDVAREKVDARGFVVSRRYFAGDGRKAWCKDGYHEYRPLRYDEDGIALEVLTEDYDPSRFSYFRARAVDTWRDLDLIRAVVTYEDEAGQPAAGPEGGTRLEREFDDEGREVVRTISGLPASMGAAAWRIETTWGSDGPARRIHRALDAHGKPVVDSGSDRATLLDLTYGVGGVLRKEVRSGGSPSRWGYARIEATFAEDGSIESVVHRGFDGAPIAVRPFIAEIAPDAQAKARELRVGDILVSAGGEPVSSSVAFSYGKPFAGGELEVERDGRRLKIGGFEPGRIGISLIDRAVK